MDTKLTSLLVTELTQARQAALNQLRPRLSLGLQAMIAAKLATEATDAAAFLSADKAAQERLAHYTFVLDPQYFEQKFLS